MPAFALISGMFSKTDFSKKYLANLFNTLIIPAIIFTLFYELFEYFLNGHFSTYTKNFSPYWIMWYLFSLFFWRLLLLLFKNYSISIILSFAVAIIAGYFDSIGYFLSISRTIYFFPFFLAGHYIGLNLYKHKVIKKLPRFLPFIVLLAVLAFFVFYRDMHHQWLYGSFSYSRLGNHSWLAGLKRFMLFCVSFSALISFLMIVPRKKIRISKYGKNSLQVYLLHGFFVIALRKIGFISAIGQLPVTLALLVLFFLSLILTFTLSSNFVAKIYKRLMSINTFLFIIKTDKSCIKTEAVSS